MKYEVYVEKPTIKKVFKSLEEAKHFQFLLLLLNGIESNILIKGKS